MAKCVVLRTGRLRALGSNKGTIRVPVFRSSVVFTSGAHGVSVESTQGFVFRVSASRHAL